MQLKLGELEDQAPAGAVPDSPSWVAQIASAWADGVPGWDRLAATRGVDTSAAAPPPEAAPPQCWWDGPPWHGQIADDEFRAIVAAYVARHGAYTPDLPEREPDVLHEWLRANRPAGQAPRVAA